MYVHNCKTIMVSLDKDRRYPVLMLSLTLQPSLVILLIEPDQEIQSLGTACRIISITCKTTVLKGEL